MAHIVITGAPNTLLPDLPPNRRPIQDVVNDPFQFSLYIQALAAMQRDGQDHPASHYQVGGIHGYPPVRWEGSGGTAPISGSRWPGYCTHGTVLFPTWHRPYVALYEQIIQKYAANIAAEYTVEPETWKKQAGILRVPYWDWASQPVPPDDIIAKEKVLIITPQDTKQGNTWTRTSVDNPFFGYHFQGALDPSFQPPYSRWHKTLRHPTTQGSDARDNVTSLKRTLGSRDALALRDDTYRMLINIDDWNDFSNHTAGGSTNTNNSLETIHDQVHGLTGASITSQDWPGHMGVPQYAAHDPIFYLHHCNVDRLLALWLAIHYDVFVTDGNSERGTWTEKANITLGVTSDLTPFWQTQTGYWNSAAVKDPKTFGYEYPEFAGLANKTPEERKTAIRKIVDRLYGSPPLTRPGRPATRSAAPAAPADQATLGIASAPGQAEEDYNEWTIRVRCKKFALKGPFTVYFFLGDPPETVSEWDSSDNYVGSRYFFVNSDMASCENCEGQADVVSECFIHITNSIYERNQDYFPFGEDQVVPQLKDNDMRVHWRIIKQIDGTVVDPDNADLALETLVFSEPHNQLVHVPRHRGPGVPAPDRGVQAYPDITRGRRGGFSGTVE